MLRKVSEQLVLAAEQAGRVSRLVPGVYLECPPHVGYGAVADDVPVLYDEEPLSA